MLLVGQGWTCSSRQGSNARAEPSSRTVQAPGWELYCCDASSSMRGYPTLQPASYSGGGGAVDPGGTEPTRRTWSSSSERVQSLVLVNKFETLWGWGCSGGNSEPWTPWGYCSHCYIRSTWRTRTLQLLLTSSPPSDGSGASSHGPGCTCDTRSAISHISSGERHGDSENKHPALAGVRNEGTGLGKAGATFSFTTPQMYLISFRLQLRN